MCKECITTQIEKYKNFVSETGKAYKEFSISCKGIPKKYLSEHHNAILSKEEQEEALTILDPVAWAEEYVQWPEGDPFVARHYQELLLRCTSQRKVSRMGRRLGKCLEEGTEIMTPTGSIEIQDLQPGDIVYAYDIDTDSVSETKVKKVFDQGMQEVVDLTRHNKKVIACTPIHRWHTTDSTRKYFKNVRRLEDFGRDTCITRRLVDIPMGKVNESHAYAIGTLLGDGCSREPSKNNIYMSSANAVVPSRTASVLGAEYYKNKANNFTWTISSTPKKAPGIASDPVECHHYDDWCRGRYAHEKTCDLEIIKQWNRESCLALLAGLLDTDGTVQAAKEASGGKSLVIRWDMQAWNVIKAVHWLLLALFQYDATIGVDNRDKYKNGPVYYLSIKNNLFCKRILRVLDTHLVTDYKKWKPEYSDFIENNENPNLFGVRFDKEKTREAYCWDISIDTKDNLYLTAQGLVTHNTWALDVKTGHYMFTNDNVKVLVIAPRKSHVDNLIGNLRDYIRMNPILANSVVRDVDSPYVEIKLNNGSRLRAFSSGTASGAEGLTVRGQDADLIILEEADFLSDKDLSTIVAILNTHPGVELWASSTPSGARRHFWRWCLHTPTYKEFYYHSNKHPDWDQMEESIKLEYAGKPDDYDHEIAAIFGEQSVGVFQNAFVDRALTEYIYEEQTRQEGWTYCVGVDWNDTYGTEIVTTGYDPRGRWRVVDVENVPKTEWTQLKSMEAVVKTNAKWLPAYVYIDKGHMGTQHELLRKYGYDMIARDPTDPACALKDIVKTFEFGSNLDMHDPMTKQPIKKYAKAFLVENTVRRFEENTIQISTYDNTLKQQLLNYIISHRTPAGRPVYDLLEESVGDHRLDAFMLSLVAFKLEMSLFSKPTFSSHIAISTGFMSTRERKENPDSPSSVDSHLRRMPSGRTNDLESNPSMTEYNPLPAKTDVYQIPTNRPGWAYDKEAEYELAYRKRQLRKKLKKRKKLARRSNI